MYFESPPKFRGLQRVSDSDTRSSDAFMHNLGLLDQENDTTPVGRVTCVRDSTICDIPTPLSTNVARSTLGLLSENQSGATCKGTVVVAEDDSPVLIRKSMSIAAEDEDLAPTPPVVAESETPTKGDIDTPAKERSIAPDDDVGEDNDDESEDEEGEVNDDDTNESIDPDHDLLFPTEDGGPAEAQPISHADDHDAKDAEGQPRSVRITNLRRPTETIRKMTEAGVDTTVLEFDHTPLALLKLVGGKATMDVPIGAAFSSWSECAEMANLLRRVGAVLEEALANRPTDREMRAYNRAKSDYEATSTDATLDTPPTEAPTLLGGGMLWEDFTTSQIQAEESEDTNESTTQSEVESSSESMGIDDSEDESYDDDEEEEDEEEDEELDTASPPRTKWRREVAATVPAADKGSPEPKRAAPKTKRPRKVDVMAIPTIEALPTMLRTLLVNCKLLPLPVDMTPEQWDTIRVGLNGWTVHALKACCRDWGVSKGVLGKGKQSLVSRVLAAITANVSGLWPVEEEVEVSQLSCVNTEATDVTDTTMDNTVTEDTVVAEKEDTDDHTETANTTLEKEEDTQDQVTEEAIRTAEHEAAEEEAEEEAAEVTADEEAKVDVFMGESDEESASPQSNDSGCNSDDEAFSSCQSTSDSDEII